MLLVLLTDQVLCLKHHHLHHLEKSAELDEVVHIVTSKPGSRRDILSDGQVCIRNGEAGSPSLVFSNTDLLHDLAVLPPHRICVLQKVLARL